jgi:hypothetical protein
LDRIEEQTGVRYRPEDDEIYFTRGKNDTVHFIDCIEFLVEQEVITTEGVPYTPGWGKIRYLLNTAPVHQDGRDMTRPAEVGGGLFLETNHDSASKKRYIKQIFSDFVEG